MKRQVKRLKLTKETVHSLESPALKVARGGDSAECITADCGFSWWSCQLSGCESCGCWPPLTD